MEYTIGKLAKLAGISTRTLRYYDDLGLLPPAGVNAGGYRFYRQKEVDRLQQILFYREMGMPLEGIRKVLSAGTFDGKKALEGHLVALKARREQLDLLIANVEKTLLASKGETTMSDREKFEGFKQKLLEDNEKEYGREAREKYGDEAVERSNAKVRGMTQEQHKELESLSQELNETLRAAFEQGDPAGPLAKKACELHKKWLCYFWDTYSKEAHMGLAQMYVDDPRFSAYYDKIAKGSAVFLRDAIFLYCK